MKELCVTTIIISSLFLFACKEQQTKNRTEAQHPIRINDPIKISIADFIVDIDTIKLETNDENLMSDIERMHIMDGKYYILTNGYTVINIFDADGQYISKIDNKGQGPKEYIRISSFEVDEINKRLILADSFSRRIFIYDDEGNQISVVNLDFEPMTVLPHKEGFVNFYSGPRNIYTNPEMENYTVHFLDVDGKFISSDIEVNTPHRIDMGSIFMAVCLSTGDILFQPILSEIVYKIDTEKNVTSFYEFENSSQYKLLTQEDKDTFELIYDKKNSFEEKEADGYLLTLGEIQDLTNFTFFGFSGWDKKHYLYYSKQTGETLLINTDSVEGNESLKEIFMTYPKSVYGDKFYISPHPMTIENVKDGLPDGMVKTFFNNKDFDSNPVLIAFSVKFPERL